MNRHEKALTHLSTASLIGAAVLWGVACQRAEPSAGEPVDDIPAATDRLQLPTPSGGASCGEPGPEPSGCAWALAADAIIYGRLDGIHLAESPAYVDGFYDEPIDPSTCESVHGVAVVLEITVVRSFGGEVPERVELHIGPGLHNTMFPSPLYEPTDGAVTTWTVRWPPLEAGQGIGAAIYYVQGYDLWTLLDDRLFGLVRSETGDHVQFGTNSEDWCSPKPPVGFSGLTVDALFDTMAACNAKDFLTETRDLESDKDARRDRVALYGVSCGPASPPVISPCTTDADCAVLAPLVACYVDWGTCYNPENPDDGPPRCAADADCVSQGFLGAYCDLQKGVCRE